MSKKLYVGNLNYQTTEDVLRDLFVPHGEVVSVKMINDRETGRFRGFAFVELADDAAADAAMQELNGKEVEGRVLKVNEARERKPRFNNSY
jgi:RNA recognition motif-containing protein